MIAATIPGQPTTPEKFSADVSQITIRWDEPVSGNGGSIITDYRVYWDAGTGSGVFVYLGNTQSYETFTVNANVSPSFSGGKTFTFQVSAVNVIGEGVVSGSNSVIAAAVPTAPSAPTLVEQSPTFIKIAWEAQSDGGSPIQFYTVLWDQAQGVYVKLSPNTGNPNILTYTVTQAHGLVTGSIYAFKIIATNAVGESSPSGRLLNIMAA